ncbi:MAG: VCBS repeat-containing protein, partial [Desulfuromonadales bacterium]|nr:VCBS repeat-containing protein [Desulfuromonadales bacterium]
MGKKTLPLLLLLIAAVLLPCVVSAGEFKDISFAAGVADDGLGKGVAFADINNDGLVDLYVSNKGGANKLYLNLGNGQFKDITAEAGV